MMLFDAPFKIMSMNFALSINGKTLAYESGGYYESIEHRSKEM